MTPGVATNIAATSSSKTITELLLVQPVAVPGDQPIFTSTQAPFSIAFTPARLGTTTFIAFVLFSDNTYATGTLNYTFSLGGSVSSISLTDAPSNSMAVGDSTVVNAYVQIPALSTLLDIRPFATYTARSGTTSVFSIGANGTITAAGNGVDWLGVTYGGATGSSLIQVGNCAYSLGPANLLVANTGGTASIQVNMTAGCFWQASSGSTWLKPGTPTGSGNGSVTLTADPNSTGSTRVATVALGSATAAVTQPATACAYGLSATHINAPGAGQNGNITVTTSCPLVVSSDSSWLIPDKLQTSVDYYVSPNPGAARTGTLTIGTQAVSVTQAAAPVLTIAKSHTGSFTQGQSGAIYTVVTANQAGAAATSGAATVTEKVPSGLTLVSMTGTGWTCTGSACSRSDVLAGGASYPSITVTVNVAANAPSQVTNQVSVSGGGSVGSTASDTTSITPSGPSHPAFFAGEVAQGNGVYFLQFPNGNLFGYYSYLSSGWIYHLDMGYVYVLQGNGPEVYLWDMSSGHWWYTNSNQFPSLYDFTLHAWLYYLPDTRNAGHYTTNPRYFANMTTGRIFTM
jgi:hypothetical protein